MRRSLGEETVPYSVQLIPPQSLLVNAAGISCCEGQVVLFSFVFFFKIQSKSKSYVSGITPRWVGMRTMLLCERERVSADHHHTDSRDATLLEGLFQLIAPEWGTLFNFFLKIRPMFCANQPKQRSSSQHNAIVLHPSKILGMFFDNSVNLFHRSIR